MPYAAPPRPPRRRDPVSGAPSELAITLRIPLFREHIVADLQVEQSAYEAAKHIAATLEEDKLDTAEEIEHEKSAVLQKVNMTAYTSQAAQKRAEDYALALSERLGELEARERGIRRALIRANEDVSVFRHRMLTLRAALAPEAER